MRFLWERMKLVVEPTGAMPLAALTSGRIPYEKGARIGVIVSGGNVDLQAAAALFSG
jgi:threonine dehydratase